MTFEKLISLCKPVSVSGPEPNELGALIQDSRRVKKNSVFIAVRGFRVDGHLFIEDAIERGASVIISEEAVDTAKKVCTLRVEDSRSLLGPLAQAFAGNPARQLTLVGITGTNGKTTVATLVYQALQKLGARPSLLGTVDKRIGDRTMDSRLTTSDPIELAGDMISMIEAGSTHLIMEVSSHALDQKRVEGVNFRVAAFTNLSHDHLDYHKSLKDYAGAKKKLFDGLEPEARAVINDDDPQASFMTRDCAARIDRFGFTDKAGIKCDILSTSIRGITVGIEHTRISSPLVGRFNAYNLAEAFLICRALGYRGPAIAEVLGRAPGADGRLERVEGSGKNGRPVVLVDYAHTPDALKNVLSTLADLKTDKQKLHLVFGCGGNRDKAKRPKMARIAERFADQNTVTSDNPRKEDPDAIIDEIMKGFRDPDSVLRITDRRKAIRRAIKAADEHTLVLIAGKGHETYQEIGEKRYDFDDRKVAQEALGNGNHNPKEEVA